MDVKKLGRIPPGGGWKKRGRSAATHSSKHRVGYDYIHSAIDAHTRLALSEVHADERGPTCAAFWERAEAFFAEHDIRVEAVLSDNAKAYLGRDFTAALGPIEHRLIRFRRPQTNGKVCEHALGAAPGRSDSGQGMTAVSFARSVDRHRCCTLVRTGRTDLT